MNNHSPSISLESVSKSFGAIQAVQGISLAIQPGEVFGLLGPNGAGKTTLIRLIMDIFRPDAGVIQVFGHPLSDPDKNRIGYLPEERGLYTRQKVTSILEYFACLKGMSNSQARSKVQHWLEKFEMTEVRNRKVQELSKGNQQKVQILATMVSEPDILILDEPFSGLDPVNVRFILNLIRQQADLGKTILLSTHQMALVETLCQRLFMINKGKQVLYGTLEEVQRQHSDNAVLVQSGADYAQCPLIDKIHPNGKTAKIYLKEGIPHKDFLVWLAHSSHEVESFERATTPLEDIFIKLAEETR
jgi:ABC-2 type transport system ATP-binding protein